MSQTVLFAVGQIGSEKSEPLILFFYKLKCFDC